MRYTNNMDGTLRWFILAFIGLWVLWVLSDGPAKLENKDKPFLEQPAPIEGWQPYTVQQLKDKQKRR